MSLLGSFGNLWLFVLVPLGIFLGSLALYGCIVGAFILANLFSGRRFKTGERRVVKRVPLVKKIFYDAPKQFVDDLFNSDPDFFKPQGLVIYTGRQGQGKTISMVYDIMRLQEEYPLCRVITNLAYKYENTALTNWKQLITYKNGIYGVVVGLDEIQNWFSCKQSKDFPPEMFEIITQNRKNRRVIFATTQNFYQPAKDIRMQCTEERRCMTIAGVFTVVHAVRPTMDTDGRVIELKHLKYYCFVHNKKLREAYDTYKVIESLMKSGFKERTGNTNVSVAISGK